MLELTSTRVILDRIELVDIDCDESSEAIDYFLLSAMLLTNIQIEFFYVRNVVNSLFALVSSELTLNGIDIESVTATTVKSSPFHISDSTVVLANGTVHGVRTQTEEFILVTFGTITLANLTIDKVDKTLMSGTDSEIFVERSHVKRDWEFDGYDSSLNMSDINDQGISVVMLAISAQDSQLTLTDSVFEGFYSSKEGGAIKTTSCNLNVDNGTFVNNQAQMGAGLYLYCSESSTCTYSIVSSSFINNYAF